MAKRDIQRQTNPAHQVSLHSCIFSRQQVCTALLCLTTPVCGHCAAASPLHQRAAYAQDAVKHENMSAANLR